MFKSVQSLIENSSSGGKKIHELMIINEMQFSGKSREEIVSKMEYNLTVMEESIKRGINGVTSHSGLTGGDGKRLYDYCNSGKTLIGSVVSKALAYAMSINEVNAAMGLICATPTAGSAGVVPAVLFAVKDELNLSKEDMINFLFTAGAFGYIIANNASISGAAGGCQAEVGSAAAMAAAALVESAGGTPEMSAEACAISIKNMLGLVCDPVAGLVEIPCIKRNAGGAAIALSSAELALAGVKSRIPCDQVINAMYRIGKSIPLALKETSQGGLAITDAGLEYKKQVFG